MCKWGKGGVILFRAFQKMLLAYKKHCEDILYILFFVCVVHDRNNLCIIIWEDVCYHHM